jgi:glutathione-regulated potassium-efflux system protein KefB
VVGLVQTPHTSDSAALDLLPVIVLLGAAVIAVPLFKRLGLGSVTGYLAAGILIGPFGLAVISDPYAILHIAELGVVMFLFIIGLEMQPSRLWAMRGEIFGLGFAQVGLSVSILTAFGLAFGYPFAQSFVAGAGFVLTSTAIVMQMLEERQVRGLPRGRRTIAILLLEDMAIVPLLAIVALLAPTQTSATTSEQLQKVGIALGATVVLIIVGRYLLNPVFRFLGQTHTREVMSAAALLVVLGAAYAMQLGGLSMAMGAFLAGVLLSESAFRHQLEADIEPFRSILLGLFFLGVGMALNLDVVRNNLRTIALIVPAYMLLKMVSIYVIAKLFKLETREAVGRAVLMAQGGEFAFVLYAAATSAAIIDQTTNSILTSAIIASMIITPFLISLYDHFMPKQVQQIPVETPDGKLSANILLIGFGRFGQIVSQPLLASGHTLSIIENSTQAIFDLQAFGFKVFYGDGTRLDILHAAGASQANLLIVAIDDRAATLKIVEIAKTQFPDVPVLARAFDREHAIDLSHAGVDWQIRETFESAVTLAQKALEVLDNNPSDSQSVIAQFRQRDIERFAIEREEGLYAAKNLIQGNAEKNAQNR